MSTEHGGNAGRHDAMAPGTPPIPTGIRHEDHVDYLQGGHLHHMREDGTIEEHSIPISRANPAGDNAPHGASGHARDHHHGPGCGHEMVPHGGHIDYLVNGRLHHPHGDHCDDHGPVETVQ